MRNLWLHGDYKNPAYLYIHALYEKCSVIVQGDQIS